MMPDHEIEIDLSGWDGIVPARTPEPAPEELPAPQTYPPTAEDCPAPDVMEITPERPPGWFPRRTDFQAPPPLHPCKPLSPEGQRVWRAWKERERSGFEARQESRAQIRMQEEAELRGYFGGGPWQGMKTDARVKEEIRQRETALREVRRELDEAELSALQLSAPIVPGDVLFSLPAVSAIWGDPGAPLSAEGQGWMIVGKDGTGKTSVACRYVKARLGLDGYAGGMWDLPLAPLPGDRSVLYLAMDRPRQMMEAFRRGLDPGRHREQIASRLHIHQGPPARSLAAETGRDWLRGETGRLGAGLVVIDSRKDLGSTIEGREVAGVANTIQTLVADGVEVLVLHHPVKGTPNGAPLLEYVSGHREVFSGLGSVLYLQGETGQARVQVHQVKPIREPVAPFWIQHDRQTGESGVLPDSIEITDDRAEKARAAAEAFRAKVLEVIEGHGGEASSATIREAIGGGSGNLPRDLEGLTGAGLIEKNGRRGPQAGYRLCQ